MSRRISAGGVLAMVVVALAAIGAAGWWIYSTQSSYRLRQGQIAARSGDFAGAERYADLLAQANRPDEAALLRGEVLFHQGQYRAALGWLNRVRAERGDLHFQASILTAQILLAQKNPRAAATVLVDVLDKNPKHADAHRWMAVIYYDQGDVSRAMPHLREVARLDPRDYRPHRLMGLILKDAEEEPEAIAAYREALRLGVPAPERAEVSVELAECLIKRFQDAEALEALGTLDSPRALALRVEALNAVGRGAEAERLLEAGLKEHADDRRLLRLHGERARMAGNYRRAADDLEKVVALDPNDHHAHYQLALAYEGLKQPEKARVHHRRQEEIKKLLQEIADKGREAANDPWNDAVRWKLADLCEKAGRPELAEMWRNAARACRQLDPR